MSRENMSGKSMKDNECNYPYCTAGSLDNHSWGGQWISDRVFLRKYPVHETYRCAYYLCEELDDNCPNCGKGDSDD